MRIIGAVLRFGYELLWGALPERDRKALKVVLVLFAALGVVLALRAR